MLALAALLLRAAPLRAAARGVATKAGRARAAAAARRANKAKPTSFAARRAERELLSSTPPPAAAAAAAPTPAQRADFAALGVPPRWAAALARLGITSPSPIQRAAYPVLFGPRRDSAVLQAETGSGKTLAYLLPCVDAAARRLEEHARAVDAALAAEVARSSGGGDGGSAAFVSNGGGGQALGVPGGCAHAVANDDGGGDYDDDGDGDGDAALPSAPGGAPRLYPAALVLVPTVELVHQVAAVAAALLPPEHAHAIRRVHGAHGLSRRESAALIVATPRAFKEGVNFLHMRALEVVVLDEADMLLSGHFVLHTLGYVLATFKQREPERRPQHIFVAATLPSRGRESVGALLERYYPPPGTVRVSTGGVHRPLAGVPQVFLHIDAALPPTRSQAAAAQRLHGKMVAAAQRVYAGSSAPSGGAPAAAAGGGGLSGDGRREPPAAGGSGVDADAAGAGARAHVGVAHSDDDLDDGNDDDGDDDDAGGDDGDLDNDDDGSGGDGAPAEPKSDVLAARMADRSLEDHVAELKAEDASRALKLDSLRRHALLEALLLPVAEAAAAAAAAGGLEDGGAPASLDARDAHAGAPAPGPPSDTAAADARGALVHKKHRKSASLLVGLSDSAAPPPGLRAREQAARAEPAASRGPQPQQSPLARYAAGELIALGLPTHLRTKLSPTEAAALPPTLVFFNSVTAAEAGRKFLAAALPPQCGFRVAALHKRVDDDARARVLADLATGAVRILVATNVASRGLDTLAAGHVIQAEFAQDVVSHLHRSGRVGRLLAGSSSGGGAGGGGGSGGQQRGAGRVTNLVTHSGLDLARAVLAAQQAAAGGGGGGDAAASAGGGLEAAFSRRRSFRKGVRKAALVAAEEAAVWTVLEEEQAALRMS